MNFIVLSFIVPTNSSTGKVPEEQPCTLTDKTRKKISCKRTMIVIDAEMARVASVERESCVCLFRWH